MSLWTPGGEHPVDRNRPDGGGEDQPAAGGPERSPMTDILSTLSDEQRAEFERLSPEEQEQAMQMIAQMNESRRQLLEAPAAMVVANHAMGLYELAAIHLGSGSPDLVQAKIAIDAFAAILDAVGDEMGDDGQTLRDALAQIQLAYVQVRAVSEGAGQEPTPEA
ncbi:MAG: hypothetical protein ACXIVQ_15420 [Acidimicrobiales bacterium]